MHFYFNFYFLIFILFFHFWPPLAYGIPDPNRICSNARSLTHPAGLGVKPATQGSQDAPNPFVPQQELLHAFLRGDYIFYQVLNEIHLC